MRLGRNIWRDLEAAMHVTAGHIRTADMMAVEDSAQVVSDLALELAEWAQECRTSVDLPGAQ